MNDPPDSTAVRAERIVALGQLPTVAPASKVPQPVGLACADDAAAVLFLLVGSDGDERALTVILERNGTTGAFEEAATVGASHWAHRRPRALVGPTPERLLEVRELTGRDLIGGGSAVFVGGCSAEGVEQIVLEMPLDERTAAVHRPTGAFIVVAHAPRDAHTLRLRARLGGREQSIPLAW